jgi:hypothetical protein
MGEISYLSEKRQELDGRTRSFFPSEGHYQELRAKGFEGRIANQDLWAWHAYDYGWRRVILQRRDDNSPIDPDKRWFDASLAAAAEVLYCRKFGKRIPPHLATLGIG